jgi:hypothetical protein
MTKSRADFFLHKSNLYRLVTWELGKKKNYLGWFEPCTTLYYPRFCLSAVGYSAKRNKNL